MKRLILRLRHSKKGFTLIELIMTIVVVGIVSIPLSLLVSQHIRSVFETSDDTLAFNLARFEMEKVNNTSYSSISSANTSNYEGYSYTVTRTVSYAYGSSSSDESVKKIQVDVKKSGSAVVLASLITYIAKNVSYGI